MINADTINEYLAWRQEKSNQVNYYREDAMSPEAWIKEIIMSEASDRINLIKDLLESDEELDPIELANKIHSLVYDPLEELNVKAGLGDEDSEEPSEEV